MFRSPLARRIAVGKLVGLLLGIAGVILLPLYVPDVDTPMLVGFFFWYITVGAIIGVFGVIDRHPVLALPLPWFVRAPILGAWMNVNLALIAHAGLLPVAQAFLPGIGVGGLVLWGAVEGAIVGLLIGGLATLAGGEGPGIVAGED